MQLFGLGRDQSDESRTERAEDGDGAGLTQSSSGLVRLLGNIRDRSRNGVFGTAPLIAPGGWDLHQFRSFCEAGRELAKTMANGGASESKRMSE